jgi:hypothetical protein
MGEIDVSKREGLIGFDFPLFADKIGAQFLMLERWGAVWYF